MRHQGASHTPLRVERFSLPRFRSVSLQKAPPRPRQGANRASAVDVVEYSGKGAKPLPLLLISSSKQGPAAAQRGKSPNELDRSS